MNKIVVVTDLINSARVTPPQFNDQTLNLHRDWVGKKLLLDRTKTIESAEVDMRQVIGHSQCYGEMTWGYMLNNLKRIGNRLNDLADKPEYYSSEEKKVAWTFRQVDDKYFIEAGKHRTTLFRYFSHFNPNLFLDGPIIKGVKVIREFFDYETMDLVKDIEERVESYSHLRFRFIGKVCGERFWRLENTDNGRGWRFDQLELIKLRDELHSTNTFKRFLGHGYQSYFRRDIMTALIRKRLEVKFQVGK